MPRTSKDLLARDVFLNVVRAHEKLAGPFADLFRAHGTTQAQYNVLRILIGAPDQTGSCQYVGEHLLNRVPDVTRLIDRMQDAGLVQRSRCPEDRRVVFVRPTAAGRELCEQLDAPVMDLHRRQLAALTARELEDLNAGLQRVLDA